MAGNEQPDRSEAQPARDLIVTVASAEQVTALAPAPPACSPEAVADGRLPGLRGTDKLAVASAICGFTAVVPVVSQVVGLALGIAGLVRIRRAKRCGIYLRGRGWALAGITSSGFALLSWIVVVALFLVLRERFQDVVQALPTVAPAGG